MPTVAALIAREACLLAPLYTAKEGLIGLVESGQHILQHMAWMAAYSGMAARMSLSSASC